MVNKTLKALASRKGMEMGVAFNSKHLNDEKYVKLVTREFNLITPEDEMILGNIHPERNRYNFGPMDNVVSFAKKNRMKIRGHPLIWYASIAPMPGWLSSLKLAKKELSRIMENHIRTIIGRYKQTIPYWCVVNEAIDDDAKLRKGTWLNGIGPQYIEMAFRIAHEAAPNAKLYYNDYSIDEVNDKSDATYRLIERLLNKRVPIHGIGLQMHRVLAYPPDPKSVERNIRRFKRLGLMVSITEMDVRLRKPITKEKLQRQAKMYSDIARVAAKTGCTDFSLWGVTDAISWIPMFFKGYDSALIFDKQYKPKPAYKAIAKALA